MPTRRSAHKKSSPGTGRATSAAPPRARGRATQSKSTSADPLLWTQRLSSPEATTRLGATIAAQLTGGEVLALHGDLGAGKTQLVRGMAEGLGADPDQIASPTFVLIHEYQGRLPLAHIDLYRLASPEELDHLGWADYLDGRWIVAVEWAEHAGPLLPDDRLVVHLQHRGARVRLVTCTATGPASAALLAKIRAAAQSGGRSASARPASPGPRSSPPRKASR